LVHITQAYAIFGDKIKAIQLCTNRFDDDTKNSFVELYTKVDSGSSLDEILKEQNEADLSQQLESEDDSDSDETDADQSASVYN
jgi:hypothetical protein